MRETRARFPDFVISPKGFTLTEVMVGIAILGVLALGAATFNVFIAGNMASEERLDARETLAMEVVRALRDPRALRASLEKTDELARIQRINCLQTVSGGARKPCLAMAAPAALSLLRSLNDPNPITGVDGRNCYSEMGDSISSRVVCDKAHPIEVLADFQIICIGQPLAVTSGDGKVKTARNECSTNQAAIVLKYQVRASSAVGEGRGFRPIKGSSFIELKNLMSANDVAAGAVNVAEQTIRKDVTAKMREYRRVCANPGEVMIGVRADGEPLCKQVAKTCPPGNIFTGLKVTGSGASFNVEPVCVSITCPPNEVFVGLDASGSPKCRALSSTTCEPYTTGAPNGKFMIGYAPPDAGPVCVKKTCLKGEIFGGYDSNGNAVCGNTSFIPACTPNGAGGGASCTPPFSATPPSLDFFPMHTNVVSIPRATASSYYQGVPFISDWDQGNGLPKQGFRNDYRDWGKNPGHIDISRTPTAGNLFRDLVPPGRGVQTTQTAEACRDEPDEPGFDNLTVEHEWYRVTERADSNCGNVPGAGDSCSRFYFTGSSRNATTYTCNYYRPVTWSCCRQDYAPRVCTPIFAPNTTTQIGENCTGGFWFCAEGGCCGGGQSTSTSHTYAVLQRETNCRVVTNHRAGTATADCPTAFTSHGDNHDGVNDTKIHRYYNWTIRSSCNFQYNRP